MTWGDDDALYGAYGDGFEPFISDKLSMGFARIAGVPPNFTGTNVRAPTGETRGDGAAGKKASGLLMVEGILYLWARNAGNAQLAWSKDDGKTWAWSDWKFTTSFGCPTFLNFGRNYASARDGFVYVYSPDSDSAYATADRLVLARVPKSRIRDRNAYEFFRAVDDKGRPVWAAEITQRGAAFTHPGRSYRSSVTYNPPLKRYLLVQPLAGAASCDRAGKIDVRFSGGLAVFDAPEPWGPWAAAFLTVRRSSPELPQHWLATDLRIVHLVRAGCAPSNLDPHQVLDAGGTEFVGLLRPDASEVPGLRRVAEMRFPGKRLQTKVG
jgi:hypothetical protein